ncbi:MAG TPA: hypothetical protein VGV39_14035 [Mesorhizobium sp.]|jgi:hypothetical protein|uniref:hypothetical protein n=1 Tax=Mesorhizobium sp. TaxID=1871066 RepID=UPI002DDCC17F|nr:hypothetical protein [Mesorhizobium sp.]HEV2504192.1 hypothetical protein [Mesorhizobium sp.]
MRKFFLLFILAGVALGLIYPWAVRNFSGEELGTWHAYQDGRFKPVTVSLKAGTGPVRVFVDLTTNADRIIAFDRTVLTLTATAGNRTVLAERLSFSGNPTPREQSPQLTDKIFRDEAGLIEVEEANTYVFTLGLGDADNMQIKAVDLVLRSGAAVPDARVRQMGFGSLAFGVIGLMLAIRFSRSQRPGKPETPPKPRWGRGAG